MTVLSTSAIRAQFPALERQHGGHPVAYFDGLGGTQVPRAGQAMLDYLYHHNANTHWAYPSSEETDRLVAGAREAMPDFLGARPHEISLRPQHDHPHVPPGPGAGPGVGPGGRNRGDGS